MVDGSGFWTIVLGSVTVVVTVLTAVGTVRSWSERRPVQRVEGALRMLAGLDAAEAFPAERRTVESPDLQRLREELAQAVRDNAAIWAVRHRPSSSSYRTLVFTEGLFASVFGTWVGIHEPQAGAKFAASLFIVCGAILLGIAAWMQYRWHLVRQARRLSGGNIPLTMWQEIRELVRAVRNRIAVRRHRRAGPS